MSARNRRTTRRFLLFGNRDSGRGASIPAPTSAHEHYDDAGTTTSVLTRPQHMPRVVLIGTERSARKLAALLTRPASADASTDDPVPLSPADVRIEPVIGVAPTADPTELDRHLRAFAAFDGLLLLSPPACTMIAARLRHLGIDPTGPDAPWVAAVAESTARAAKSEGFRVDHTSRGATAKVLVEELIARAARDPARPLRGTRILAPRSSIATEGVLLPLRDAGARVIQVTAYENRPQLVDEPFWRSLAEDPLPPLLVFLSSSAVTALWSGLPLDLQSELFPRCRALAIGPSTARTLDRVQIPLLAAADPPGLGGLAACVHDALGVPRSAPPAGPFASDSNADL